MVLSPHSYWRHGKSCYNYCPKARTALQLHHAFTLHQRCSLIHQSDNHCALYIYFKKTEGNCSPFVFFSCPSIRSPAPSVPMSVPSVYLVLPVLFDLLTPVLPLRKLARATEQSCWASSHHSWMGLGDRGCLWWYEAWEGD